MSRRFTIVLRLLVFGYLLTAIRSNADIFPLGKVYSATFSTYNSSGALTNADSTPTCQAFIGSSNTAVNSGTVTNISTGFYRCQITMSTGNGFAADSSYSIIFTATVGGQTQIAHHSDGVYLLATPNVAGILVADTSRWLGGTPNGLTSGRLDATVGAVQTGAVTAAALAADTVTAAKVAADVATELQTGLTTFPKNVAFANYKFYLSKASADYNSGNSSNITCELIKDNGSLTTCDSASQASIAFKSKGIYNMTIAAADMNANTVWIRLYVPTDSGVSVWQQQLVPGH